MKKILLFLKYLLFSTASFYGQEFSRHEADSMILKLNEIKSVPFRIELLCNLAQFHILKPGENQIDFDSAIVFINEAKFLNKSLKSSSAEGYLLLTESYLTKEKGNTEEGKKMVEKAIMILKSGTNNDYLGQAYYELSMYHGYEDSLQTIEKIKLVEQSLDPFQQAGDLKRKGRSLEMMGDLYDIIGNNEKSLQSLKEAVTTYNSINYPRMQGVYLLLGRYYFLEHDYVPALSYMLKALKITQSIKDSSMQLCQINNYLGLLYTDIDRLDMAAKYLNDALDIARKHNVGGAIASVASNLSFVYNNMGQPDLSLKVLNYLPEIPPFSEADGQKSLLYNAYLTTYLNLGQLQKARPFCDLAVRAADEKINKEDLDRRAKIYMHAAYFYFLTKQYAKASNYLTKSSTLVKGGNYDYVHIRNLQLAYKLDSAKGNFNSAYNHLLLYKEKTDSIFSQRKIRQFQVMNVEYEVEMKEDSIRYQVQDIALLRQRNSLQQANLKQVSLVKNVTIAGIVVAILIIGLLYRQYRNKQKTNHLLQSQKEEINSTNQELKQLNEQQTKLLVEKDWLVKEIHHRVKNNLQMVISLLNAQSEYLNHPSAINAIRESRERMQAISILHQKLYRQENTTLINMRSYIKELVASINGSLDDTERIYFSVEVANISLDISQSVPLGLILNEAITNAIKYAYPEKENGSIYISLQEGGSQQIQLRIADHGKGLPADADMKQCNSLGMQLIRLFSEQLEGDLYFVNNSGLEIILNFRPAGFNDAAMNKITV